MAKKMEILRGDSMDETMEKEMERRQEIINLTCDLTSPVSDIGDWKITKINEARINGDADPYNVSELTEKRQAIRNKITALHKELGDEVTDSTDTANEIDTGYMRTKEAILRQFVAALMAEDTDLQSALKDELKELDASYDAQKKGE